MPNELMPNSVLRSSIDKRNNTSPEREMENERERERKEERKKGRKGERERERGRQYVEGIQFKGKKIQ